MKTTETIDFVLTLQNYLLSLHIIMLQVCFRQTSIVVKRHHDRDNSYERKHIIGASLAVSEALFIVIMAGSTVASRQAVMVLNKDLRYRHLNFKTTERQTLSLEWAFEISQPTTNRTDNKASPTPKKQIVHFISFQIVLIPND